MSLQAKIVVSVLLLGLMFWMIRQLSKRRLGSGEVLFWLVLLVGAETLTLFPQLVGWMSRQVWGNLPHVSWITLMGLVSLISFLLYQSGRVRRLQDQLTSLVREVALLEASLREERSG